MTLATARPLVISPGVLRGGGDPAARTPPGHTRTLGWPGLEPDRPPSFDPASWTLRVFGVCARPYVLSWDDLRHLPSIDVRCDLHSGSKRSRLNAVLGGVPTLALLDLAQPASGLLVVVQHSAVERPGPWMEPVSLRDFAREDCLLATECDGQQLPASCGGPARILMPQRPLEHGAPWLIALELRAPA